MLLGDALVRGSWVAVARLAGPALLVVWAAWMLLVRPSIRVLRDRAVVVNIGRITEVPWVRVIDIRRRLQLVLDLDDGRSLEAWGSPFPPRGLAGRRGQTTQDDPAASVLRAAWQSGLESDADASVIRRPDLTALALGGVAAVAAAASLWGAGAVS